MKVIRYICDCCGKEIGEEGVRAMLLYFDTKTGEVTETVDKEIENREFCLTCAIDAVHTLKRTDIKDGETIPAATEAAPEEHEGTAGKSGKPAKPGEGDGSGRRSDLDIGKVMALHDAGWDSGRIADEMRVGKDKIQKAVWYQKNKKRLDEKRRAKNDGDLQEDQ